MKNDTIMEYADNGIIIRYDDGFSVEVWENKDDFENEYTAGVEDSVARSYGQIVKNTIECFDDDTKKKAIGYKVLLEIVPVFEEKNLYFKKKKN